MVAAIAVFKEIQTGAIKPSNETRFNSNKYKGDLEPAAEFKQLCNIAKRQLKHLTHLIDDLLDVLRITVRASFTPFSQEHRSIAGSKGLGLSLSLAKGIIKLHNGRIYVSSEGRDRGTEFTIELPCLDREDLDIDLTAKKERTTSVAMSGDREETANNSGRILIIEDEVDSALLLQTFLEGSGYQVEIAFNGTVGIALARQFSPDIILSDINLTAEMDGYTVARTIRNDSELNSICLIAITGYGQPEDKDRAKIAGFDAHLTKPIDLYFLENAIAEKLAKKANKSLS